MSSTPTRKETWNQLLNQDIPRLAQRPSTTYADSLQLYRTISQGPGDWVMAEQLKVIYAEAAGIVHDKPQNGHDLYRTRYLGKNAAGQEVYTPTSTSLDTVNGVQMYYEALSTGVLGMWKALCDKFDRGFLTYSRDPGLNFPVQVLPTMLGYFRTLGNMLHFFEDGNGRTLDALTILQFRRVGINIQMPFTGVDHKVPHDNALRQIEMYAHSKVMQAYAIPLTTLGGDYYDMRKRGRETTVNLAERKISMTQEEYQRLLKKSLMQEIDASFLHWNGFVSDTLLEHSTYVGWQLLSFASPKLHAGIEIR